MNALEQITQAVRDAESYMRAGDEAAQKIARLLPGRLRHVDHSTCVRLKKELRNFNIHTNTWKE